MISKVDFDDSPIKPGERRTLTAWSDAQMSVGIRCFTDDPPPPGYKTCASCGTVPAHNGKPVPVVADRRTFQHAKSARLDVILKDTAGDMRKYELAVLTNVEDASGVLTA